MANDTKHAALPYPIYGAKYTHSIPYANPSDEATAYDTEISKDGGAFSDCTEEITQLGTADCGYITHTAAEMSCDLAVVKALCVASQKPTIIELRPRKLPIMYAGTAAAGDTDEITLDSASPAILNSLVGSIVRTTGGTGPGQARLITAYTAARVASVSPDWETTPDNTTTYDILVCETSQHFGVGNVVLSTTVANVEANMVEHCLGTIVLAMLENSILSTTLTIKGTDGSTTRFTKTLSTDPTAEPIIGIQ